MALEAAYAEMWAQDAAAMYAYQAESAAATSALPQFTQPPQTTTRTTLKTTPTTTPASTQTLLSWLLGQLSNSGTLLGQLNAYAQAFTSSGPYTIPTALLQLFTVLWAVSSPESALGQAITNRINTGGALVLPEVTMPAASVGSSKFAEIRAGIGDGERLGARLSVPPSWAQQREPTQAKGAPASPIVATPDVAALGGLGGLGGLGALGAIPRGGTPTKQQRPEPDYGVRSTVMPKHPYGG